MGVVTIGAMIVDGVVVDETERQSVDEVSREEALDERRIGGDSEPDSRSCKYVERLTNCSPIRSSVFVVLFW